MEKILVFADAHGADKEMYSQLLKHIELGEIKKVRFLGDIDYAEGYLDYFDFKQKLIEKRKLRVTGSRLMK